MLAIFCGLLWNAAPGTPLLAAELLCCIWTFFPVGVTVAGGTIETIPVPDFYMCLLYGGVVTALFLRSLTGYLRKRNRG